MMASCKALVGTTRPECAAAAQAASRAGTEADGAAPAERTCRICYASEPTGDLVVPCGCKGSHRYCHLECLRSWQAMMQAGNFPVRARQCAICNVDYRFAPLAEPVHKWLWRQVATPLNAVLQGCMTPFQFISCVGIVAVVSFGAGFLSTSLLQHTGGRTPKPGALMLDLYSSWDNALASSVLLFGFFVLMSLALWALIIPGPQAMSISAAVTLAVAAAATSHTAAYSALAVVSVGTALSEADCLDVVAHQALKLVRLVLPPTVIRLPGFMRIAEGA